MSIGMFGNEQPRRRRRNDEIRMPNVEGNHNHEAPIGSATRSYSGLFGAIQRVLRVSIYRDAEYRAFLWILV